MSQQHDTAACPCGGVIQIRQTSSPWEFRGQCDRCLRGVLTSWAHAEAPPVFMVAQTNQVELFSEASA